MGQYKCPNCDGNIRTLGMPKGTKVYCRHCGTISTTTEDNEVENKAQVIKP